MLLSEVRYQYDLSGRMIARTELGSGGQVVQHERFAHAGNQVLLTLNPQGQVRERFLYGPQVDQLIAVTRIGQAIPVVWALADHQGTVRDVLDNAGQIRRHWAYDSFGNVVATSGAEALASFNVLYTGREFDATTGLYFYRARWYDPVVGRFTGRDPIGLDAGPNPFAYVNNQATTATDPSGQIPLLLLLIPAAGALVGAAHTYGSSRAAGWSQPASFGWGLLGAVGGWYSPLSALLGGAGAAIGYGVAGERGAAWGSLGGMLGGSFLDARYLKVFGMLPACAATRPYLAPSLQLSGAVAGAGYGYLTTETLDGALAGANFGALLGGIGATVYNLLRPCFVAGTLIDTPDGLRPIEDIEAGDRVWSRDENDPEGPVLAKVVEEKFVRTGQVWRLTVEGEEIGTTSEHPFYARGRGWMPVRELTTSDVLLSKDGRWLRIEAVEDTGTYQTVYNFRVADFHTYFIGGLMWNREVWTHNSGCVVTDEMMVAYNKYVADVEAKSGRVLTVKQRTELWKKLTSGELKPYIPWIASRHFRAFPIRGSSGVGPAPGSWSWPLPPV